MRGLISQLMRLEFGDVKSSKTDKFREREDFDDIKLNEIPFTPLQKSSTSNIY